MDFKKHLYKAIYAQDKRLLSVEFLYSTEGIKAAQEVAYELNLPVKQGDTFFSFIDRIFERAEIVKEVNETLFNKMNLN